MSLTLDTYRLLGRSGLRVSPLALGAATFGTEWGWGAEQDEARKLFDLYVERGGNFIDTASHLHRRQLRAPAGRIHPREPRKPGAGDEVHDAAPARRSEFRGHSPQEPVRVGGRPACAS